MTFPNTKRLSPTSKKQDFEKIVVKCFAVDKSVFCLYFGFVDIC